MLQKISKEVGTYLLKPPLVQCFHYMYLNINDDIVHFYMTVHLYFLQIEETNIHNVTHKLQNRNALAQFNSSELGSLIYNLVFENTYVIDKGNLS